MLKSMAMAIATAAIVLLGPQTSAFAQSASTDRQAGCPAGDQDDTRLQSAKPCPPAHDEEEDEDPTKGWNRMKRGFYTGLVVGGVVGVLAAIDCGHPECGPLISLAAGAGAGIGLTIDLLFVPERPIAPAAARRNDGYGVPFTTGRRVALGFRTSW
jgi:hypothetical protein